MNRYMNLIGQKAKKAVTNKIDSKKKNKILKKYLNLIEKEKNLILKENKKDVKLAINKKIKDNMIQRLILDHKKLNSIKTINKRNY